MAPRTVPVVFDASATDIIITTYSQPITTRYTAFLFSGKEDVSLLEAAGQTLGKTRNLSPEEPIISRW